MKAQLSLEFLIILIVMLLLFSNISLDLIDKSLSDAEAFNAAETIKAANSSLYATMAGLQLQGPGAKRTVYLRAPAGCNYIASTTKVTVSCSSTSPAAKYNLMQIGPELTGANYTEATVASGTIGALTVTLAGVVEAGGGGGGGGGGGENQAPTVKLSYSCDNLFCEFDSTGSADSDGYIANNEWDFGDSATDVGISTFHTYAAAGSYKVTYTATDDDGAETSKEVTVKVVKSGGAVNQDPVAVIKNKDTGEDVSGKTMEAVPDQRIHFDGTGSYDTDGSIDSYSWDFGESDPDVDDTSGDSKPIYWYYSEGTYTVTLKVTDDKGLTNEVTTTVKVAETAGNLVVVAGSDTSVERKSVVDVSCTATDSDTNGGITKFEWDTNEDGTYDTTHTSGFTINGNDVTDKVSYTGMYTGERTVTCKATSKALKTKTATVNVKVLPIFEKVTLKDAIIPPVYVGGEVAISPDGKKVVIYYSSASGFSTDNVTVFYSKDYGITWKHVNVSVWDILLKDTTTPYSVVFSSNSIVWMVGENGIILKSNNGGATWTKYWAENNKATTDADLFDISFGDSDLGYIVGKDSIYLETIDGGSSWASQIQKNIEEDIRTVSCTQGISPAKCLALGGNRTYLNGQYRGQKLFHGAYPWSVYMVDSNKAWAVDAGSSGIYPQIYPQIYYTTDKGATWTNHSFCTSGCAKLVGCLCKDMSFADIYFGGDTGLIVGEYTDTDKPLILRTLDQGSTWEEIGSDINDLPNKGVFYGTMLRNETYGWATGFDLSGSPIELMVLKYS